MDPGWIHLPVPLAAVRGGQRCDYNDDVRACGLKDRITSSVRLPMACSSETQVIVLHRSAADGDYAQRAVRLVRLVHEELLPLLGKGLALATDCADERPPPPQLQLVLAHLLLGESEKQMAARLGLSRHTVNRHVQRLYRRFNVRSRGELMAHVSSGRSAAALSLPSNLSPSASSD